MKNWLGLVLKVLAANKRSLAVAFCFLVVTVLVARAWITPEMGLAALIGIAAIFCASLHDALERHRSEVLPILVDWAAFIRDMAKNRVAAEPEAVAAAVATGKLVTEIQAEKGQPQ